MDSIIAERVISIVLMKPGVKQCGLAREIGCHSQQDINRRILELCAAGVIARIQDGQTFRLYMGDVPAHTATKAKSRRPLGIWQMNDTDFNKGHGVVFFMAFDRMVEEAKRRLGAIYEQPQRRS